MDNFELFTKIDAIDLIDHIIMITAAAMVVRI
jgi:hypothetical protein